MRHVELNEADEIIGVYARPQPGLSLAVVEDDDSRLVDYQLSSARAAAKNDVDVYAGYTRRRFASEGDLLSAEYELAEREAQAYADAGYEGDVPASVQSWADASGKTPEEAANHILATADLYQAVLNAVRAIRLDAKASIDAASSEDEIHNITAAAKAAMDAIAQ